MSIQGNPYIVHDSSLVLSLDAANVKSYPTTGTSWVDLSNNSNIGTLVNTPTFNSGSGGNFSFNGTNNQVILPENSALNTQTPSVEVWVKINATSHNGFFFEKGNVNTQYSLFQEGTFIRWRHSLNTGLSSLSVSTADYISTSNWAHIVGTYISGQRRMYINGALVNSEAQTGTIATNANGSSIGVYGGYNGARGYYYNGSIGSVKVYNKVLTPSEVLQNYNATKSRFGL